MLSYRSGGRLLDSVAPGGAVAVPIQGHIFEGPGEDRNSCFVQLDMVIEACEVQGGVVCQVHIGFKCTGTGEVGIHPLDSVRVEVFSGQQCGDGNFSILEGG